MKIIFKSHLEEKLLKKIFFSSKSLEKSLPKCKHILFLHAFTSCDTMSAFFNKGLLHILKIAKIYVMLLKYLKMFQAGVACILACVLSFNSFLKGTVKKTCVQFPFRQ